MNNRTRKIAAWTIGMALAGAFLGAKGSHADTWYGALVDDPAFILGGAFLGLVLGFVFALRLPVSE
jgi:hypothetical protein